MKVRHLVWACLLLAVANRPGPVLGETEYFAVFLEGKKFGHVVRSRLVADGKVTTTETARLTLSRADTAVTTNTTATSIETVAGEPLGFECVQDLGALPMKTLGTVNKDGTLTTTTSAMGEQIKSTIDWPSGAVMAEGLRLLQMKKGLKEGVSYAVTVFDPGVTHTQALDVQISVGPKRSIDLLGRVVTLTEVKTAIKMPAAGELVSMAYVDKDFRTQKSVTPFAGMHMEMVACAKEFALSENDVVDLVEKLFLRSPQPLDNVNSAESFTYYLTPTSEANELKIPSTDNQVVRPGKGGGVIVTVKPVAAAPGAKFPYKGKDKAILEALKPNRFLQSDHKQIIELARSAVGSTKDAAEAVKKIEAFVANYMERMSLSVGYASAVEVAASKQGDCSEYAVLTASMCRAVGIPAQVAVGMAYVKEFAGLEDCFGGHAWVRAYVGAEPASRKPGKWVGLDAAFKSAGLGGYGPDHIALTFGNGEPADFFDLLTTFGQFKIDKVVVSKRTSQ